MARPRFSEMLVSRRHQLGLSVAQASRVLKLKEQVLVAFEEGDFENMPKSGYAQGMLSSYARYLGINPREVVDLYQEELYEYLHGTSSHELRRRTRDTQSGRGIAGYDLVNESDSRPKAYVEYRPLLPTGGGKAGDMGAFSTTSGARPRSAHVPLVNGGAQERPGSYSHSQYETGHAYNSDEVRTRSYIDPSAPVGAARRRALNDPNGRLGRESQVDTSAYDPRTTEGEPTRARRSSSRGYRRDDVRTRHVRSDQYTDDMLLDDGASNYELASTRSGRRKSHKIASSDRPNVRRRPNQGSRGRESARDSLRKRGIVGVIVDFFTDPRRAIALIVGILALVLTVVIITSVSSCVSGKGTSTKDTVEVTPAGQEEVTEPSAEGEETSGDETEGGETSETEQEATETSGESEGEGEATSGEATTGAETAEVPTTTVTQSVRVQVRIGSGEISWLEIQCDGQSMVADTVTGPFNETYTVTDSITIQAGDTSVVTVYEDGAQQQFESRASGVGTLTITSKTVEVPIEQTTETTAEDGTTTEGDASAGTQG